MYINAELKESTKEILKEELKLDKLTDILDKEYIDVTVCHSKTEKVKK